MDGRVEKAEMFFGSLEEGKVTMGVRRNAKLLKFLFVIVVAFEFGG